jgi:hypothetical protein
MGAWGTSTLKANLPARRAEERRTTFAAALAKSRPQTQEITMRTTILMAPIVLLLAGGGTAFAQSGQGGYLGQTPGKDVPSVSQDLVKPPPAQGSGQGGYLGEKAGGSLPTASQDPMKPPPAQGSREGGYLG